jgi:hypothetical protein
VAPRRVRKDTGREDRPSNAMAQTAARTAGGQLAEGGTETAARRGMTSASDRLPRRGHEHHRVVSRTQFGRQRPHGSPILSSPGLAVMYDAAYGSFDRQPPP